MSALEDSISLENKILKTDICNIDKIDSILELKNLIENHEIWNNPLLVSCEKGELSKENFRYIFSQYYYYSKNFTKLLATALVKCDSDYYRSLLSNNLWEEGGGSDINQRHSEIFRKFLTSTLHINLDEIIFEPYTELFFQQYLSLCLDAEPAECAAILSFGTEGIVPRLYKLFKKGLLHVGINEKALDFFNIHICCDDEHARTLEEMVLSYFHEPSWLDRCKKAALQALNIRNIFFKNIYNSLKTTNLNNLIERISTLKKPPENSKSKKLHYPLHQIDNQLYQNEDIEKNIKFKVDRIPFETDVLDPRIVYIPKGFTNELHSHAHETIFFILSGEGEVNVGDHFIKVKSGDVIFVPRWLLHQTKNTGEIDLIFFAITDYGLTKLFPCNSETVYRLRKNNLVELNFKI